MKIENPFFPPVTFTLPICGSGVVTCSCSTASARPGSIDLCGPDLILLLLSAAALSINPNFLVNSYAKCWFLRILPLALFPEGRRSIGSSVNSVFVKMFDPLTLTPPGEKCQYVWLTTRLTVDGTLGFSCREPEAAGSITSVLFNLWGPAAGVPHGSSAGRHIPLCLRGGLLCDSDTGAAVGGLPPAIPLGRPPAPLPPGSTGIDPSRDAGSQGSVSRSTWLAPTLSLAPVGTGRGKLIVCLQRLDIVNVFAIDGVR